MARSKAKRGGAAMSQKRMDQMILKNASRIRLLFDTAIAATGKAESKVENSSMVTRERQADRRSIVKEEHK